jgi:5'-phosphate synthase pdxT subunit
MIKIGILGIQGDVYENVVSTNKALEAIGEAGRITVVKTPQEISRVDGLIIPGGESTVIGYMSQTNGSLEKIKDMIKSKKMPVFGICAGLILLSKNAKDKVINDNKQPLLGLLDVRIMRNAFGRQRESFQKELNMEPINISRFNGIFIRAPSITSIGKGVDIICKIGEDEEKIVAVKQENILGTSFHPELTHDISIHKYFVNMIINHTKQREKSSD